MKPVFTASVINKKLKTKTPKMSLARVFWFDMILKLEVLAIFDILINLANENTLSSKLSMKTYAYIQYFSKNLLAIYSNK